MLDQIWADGGQVYGASEHASAPAVSPGLAMQPVWSVINREGAIPDWAAAEGATDRVGHWVRAGISENALI